MAENLGEVRVQIQEEGAQDAADTIGDAMGESGDGGQDGGGGTVGGMLGGISAKLAGILALVGFLASLEPIQELLSGIQRFFSVALLPLIALLSTFLRPILQKLLRFVGNLDFDNLAQDLSTKLGAILERFLDAAVEEIKGQIIGGETAPGIQPGTMGGFNTLQPEKIQPGDQFREGPFGSQVARGSTGEDIFVNVGLLDEQSPTSYKQNAAESSSKETTRNKAGPE